MKIKTDFFYKNIWRNGKGLYICNRNKALVW